MRGLAAAVLALAFAGSASAQHRPFVGARNLGMGNAGVASTTDALSVYFNPAGMAFATGWEVQLPIVTIDAEVGSDIFRSVDDVVSAFDGTSLSEYQQRFNDGTATRDDLARVLDAFLYNVPALSGGEAGGNLRGITGPAFRWKNWGVSSAFIGNGGADAVVDLENGLSLSPELNYGSVPDDGTCGGDSDCLALADDLIATSGSQLSQQQAETLADAAGSAIYDNPAARDLLNRIVAATGGDEGIGDNSSGLNTATLAIAQVAGTYSRLIWKDQLSVGANLKLMRGKASRVGVTVGELEDGRSTLENLLDDLGDGQSSTELGLDVGFMYRPNAKWSVGLVGTNLNTPTFDFDVGGSVELDSVFTLGGAAMPWKWFRATIDVDLNDTNSQIVAGLEQQYWKLGTEFLIGRVVSLWAGAYENFAARSRDPVVTGGLGLRFGQFQVALAASFSTDSIDIDEDSSFPRAAGAALTLAWLPKRQ